MSILEIIGTTLLVILAWKFISAIQLVKKEIESNHQKIVDQEVKKIIREVYVDAVESNGKQIFLVYDADTHDFIAQGTTQEEAQTNVGIRFPNVLFVSDGMNLKKIGS